MGIWVRSQHRELLKECNSFEYEVGTSVMDEYVIYSDGEVLGVYSTQEKALKVLDMIDDFKNKPRYVMNTKYEIYPKTTFNMPKDEEV